MKFYKVVARPSLLYGSETWVTTKRDMTRLQAAEMRFLRSVTGYTRLDKIRSEDIRQELEISAIQDLRLKYKQNWINHLERTDNTRPSKYALTYKPREEGTAGAPGNDGNASMPEQVKLPNPWRRMMMMMMMMMMMRGISSLCSSVATFHTQTVPRDYQTEERLN